MSRASHRPLGCRVERRGRGQVSCRSLSDAETFQLMCVQTVWDVCFTHIFSCSKNLLSWSHASTVWISAFSPKLAAKNPACLLCNLSDLCEICWTHRESKYHIIITIYTAGLTGPQGWWHLLCLVAPPLRLFACGVLITFFPLVRQAEYHSGKSGV